MAITVNGPNGVSINFPDGTPSDVINQAMQQATGLKSEAAPKTGVLEAIGRAAVDTGSFGFANALQDRERMKAARAEHPIASFAGDVLGVLPTLALGPAAGAARAAQAAGNLSRVGNVGAKAVQVAEAALMPNLGARTAVQAGTTAAKVGVAQGALHGLGDSVTNPDASWTDVPLQMGKEAAVGGLGGMVIGPAVHGVGKVVGAVANRALPGLKDTQRVASEWDSQGARDVIRHANYDGVDLSDQLRRMTVPGSAATTEAEARQIAARVLAGEDAAAVAQRMGKPLAEVQRVVEAEQAIRNRYDNLNLMEAVKQGDLRPLPHTGELRPDVVTTRNTDQLARWAANTEGRGQNEAAHAFAARKDEMGALMQRDIDRAFESGNREADAAGLDAIQAAIGKRYDRLRNKAPNIDVVAMGGLERHPVMKKALDEAALNDLVRNPGQGLVRWQAADGSTRTDGLQTLTPANILDIHRILAANARSAFTEPAEARMAGLLKQHFTTFVDGVYSKHKALRTDFANFKAVQEAADHGVDLAQLGRIAPPETVKYLRTSQGIVDTMSRRIEQLTQQIATEQAVPNVNPRRIAYLRGQVNRAQNALDVHADRLDEIKKSFGYALKQQIAMAPDPNALTRRMLTQEGKSRILSVLGQNDGQAFIAALYNKRTQQELGNKLYGNSDTAFKMQKNDTMDALNNVVMGLMHLRPTTVVQGLGDLASNAYRQRRADQVNDMMSRQGVDEVRRILESLVARQSLTQTAQPYVRNPALIASPAVGAQGVRDRNPKDNRPWQR